jgi:hypothetical protein
VNVKRRLGEAEATREIGLRRVKAAVGVEHRRLVEDLQPAAEGRPALVAPRADALDLAGEALVVGQRGTPRGMAGPSVRGIG